ncbi:PAS domain-containing protein, partial [Pseudomonas donghuensis]|nr:PAS domain-containing protein [Pseudomonas donghuensis]
RLTRELEAARAFNASILENAAEGILVVDAQGIISFANPAISRLLSAPVQQLQGVHLLDLVQLASASLWGESDFYQAYL